MEKGLATLEAQKRLEDFSLSPTSFSLRGLYDKNLKEEL